MSDRREAFKPGSGVQMVDWPGYKGGTRSGAKHCPTCAACTEMRCAYKTKEHSPCRRHYEMAAKYFDDETGRLK